MIARRTTDVRKPQHLSAEGWGPLRIGMSQADVTATLGTDANPEAVGGPEPNRCDEFKPQRAPEGLLVMIQDGRLTRISLIDSSAIKTDRGLGLGDRADTVKAAYKSDAVVTPHKYVKAPAAYITWWAQGSNGSGYNNDPTARGIRYEIGSGDKVSIIHAGGPSIQFVEGCL